MKLVVSLYITSPTLGEIKDGVSINDDVQTTYKEVPKNPYDKKFSLRKTFNYDFLTLGLNRWLYLMCISFVY